MKFDRLEYLVALRRSPQTLIIQDAGDATYTSYTNTQTLDRPEIGVYRTLLTGTQMASLQSLLAPPTLADLPDHAGRVLSGDLTRLLRLTLASRTIEKFVGTTEPVDERLDRIFAKLDEVVTQVREHPLSVLQVRSLESALDPDGTLRLNVGFSNPGSQTVYCRHPQDILDAWKAKDGRLVIQAWPDKPLPRLEAGDIISLKVKAVKQLFLHEKVIVGKNAIEIPPKGWIQFEFNASSGLKTTEGYVIRLTYASLLQKTADGRPLVVGEILSRL